MAIAGGINLMTTATEFLNLGKAGFLSPNGQCKPFGESADGYCRGEGTGVVVLKKLSHAKALGDNILAVIPGISTNQGGLSTSITIPHSPSQIALYRKVLEQAGMQGSQIGYVEVRGTGTQAGDPLEMESIRQVFGGNHRAENLLIGSIKANIGHLETAAGVMSLVKAVLIVNKGKFPPMANHRRLNPKIDDLSKDNVEIPRKDRAWAAEKRVVCVNIYGAAGSNAALLLCGTPLGSETSHLQREDTRMPYPISISAHNKTALRGCTNAIKKYLSSLEQSANFANVALTLAKRYRRQKFVSSHICSSLEGFHAIDLRDEEMLETPKTPKKLILVFAGQSRRNVGCDESIYHQCLIFRSHIHRCEEIILQLGYPSIIPLIFQPELISDVVALHCGTFAVQYACARSWIDCGLQVDAVIGHSFGELTAIVIAGILSLEDAITFVGSRAQLMKKHLGAACGSMLALRASADEVCRMIAPLGPDSPELACYNSQAGHVVSGSATAITRLSSSIYHDLRPTVLDVDYAFHSKLLDPILDELAEVAKQLNFREGKIPIESCTETALNETDASRLVRHTREPVWFCIAVQRLEQRHGGCMWLEAGMGSSIIPLIKRASTISSQHCFAN